jgi:CheY-like chemotaxis protein
MPGQPPRILLVGHCGPDSTYLRMFVKSAFGEVSLTSADDQASLDRALAQGIDLILLNRELGMDFTPDTGIEMIRALKPRYPAVRMMLVSNFPQAQTQAVSAGAVPGFGKRAIGSPAARQLLRDALSP